MERKDKIIINILLLIIVLLCSHSLVAQFHISGSVTDSSSGEPLEGVNIIVDEHENGTTTNADGEYIISGLSAGQYIINFSFVGYRTEQHKAIIESTDRRLDINLEPSIIELKDIVISYGYSSTQHHHAVKIDLLNKTNLDQMLFSDFTETLTQIPGVDMIAKGPGLSKPVIRGLSGNNILILNNGVRMENYQYSANHPLGLDEFGVDKVEVIKGPASLLYGSDAMGGVINVIRETQVTEDQITGDYNLQYHSNTDGVSTNLGINGASGGIFGGIRIGGKTHSDYTDGNGDYVPNTRFNQRSLKANVGLNKPAGTFELFYDQSWNKIGMCVDQVLNDDLIMERSRKNDIWFQDLSDRFLYTRNRLVLGDSELEINAGYQTAFRKLISIQDDPIIEMNLNTFTYESKLYFPLLDTFDGILGYQGRYQTNRNKNNRAISILPDVDLHVNSIFTFLQKEFGKHLIGQTGIRYDHQKIERLGSEVPGGQSSTYSNLNGSAGITYKFTDNMLVRVNIASGYRSPNLSELYSDGLHGERYEIGNPDLSPEKNIEEDINFHVHFDHSTFDLSVFNNHINDHIYLNPTGAYTDDGFPVYEFTQSNAYIRGLETEIKFSPCFAEWLQLYSNYALIKARRQNEQPLPLIPSPKLRLGIKAEKENFWTIENMFLAVDHLYAFKQDHPSEFETSTDGYGLLNLSAGGEINAGKQKVELIFNVSNVFNTIYTDHLSTLKPLGIYNPGRNVSINLTIPF